MNASRVQSIVYLIVVWIIAATLLISRIDRGWIPHDEGTIAHSAERVLAGELPHRDFDDVYTGGLAYVNAGAMRMFGLNLRSPRIVLVAAFLACLPAFFYAAGRFVGPLGAAATTLLAALWSLPNYMAAMPSWYNLIFAVFGLAALLRFVDTSHRRWLVVAGICGGLSFLIKLVGLYFVAGGLLFLVLREQESGSAAATGGTASQESRTPDSLYQIFVASALLLFVLALSMLVVGAPGVDFHLNFVLPGAALAVALLWSDRRSLARTRPSLERFRALAAVVIPFMLGVLVPVALFLVPYVVSGAVGDFVHGVFVAPTRRLMNAAAAPLPWVQGLPVLFIVAAVIAARRFTGRAAILLAVGVAVAGALAVLTAGPTPTVYRTFFYAIVPLPIVTVVASAAIIAGANKRPSLRRQRLMIVAAGLTTFALIQFPFASVIYFCYLTPLLALTAVALISELELPSFAVPAALAATFIAFAATRVNPGFVYAMGLFFRPYAPLTSLTMSRAGGVRVPPPMSDEYGRVVDAVRRRDTRSDAYIYAAPDAPEIYFLSGRRNPTRTLYDFFDDPSARTVRLLGTLREKDVRVVAINTRPGFSGVVSADLRAALEREYPHVEGLGKFEVRWRE